MIDPLESRLESTLTDAGIPFTRVCVLCKHWHCDYQGDYSELTPGRGFAMRCDKEHYYVTGYDLDDEDEFRSYILKARECPDFKAVKERK